MAKKKAGQHAKVFPKVGQEWRETSGEIEHILVVLRQTQDTDHKETWECSDRYEDEDGVHDTERTFYLADFGEHFMQLLTDPQAPQPGPTPEILCVPIKNGFQFKCPSPNCGDTHDEEDVIPFSELTARHDRFRERHISHMAEGTLFGAKQ